MPSPQSLELSGDELNTVLENLAKLSDKNDEKPLRRRLSRNISTDEIERLINELQNFDYGAQDKRPALRCSGSRGPW